MSKSDIEQVKEDIETIKEVVGFELPFAWDSVLMNIILYPLTGIWILSYWWIADKPSRFWVAVPVAIQQFC